MNEKKPFKRNLDQWDTDSLWIEKIRRHDEKAFERLFYRYCQSLVYFARRMVQDTQVAENLVQDVFLKIWMNRTRLDPSLKIRSYLYTAVRNRALKHLRHADVKRRWTEVFKGEDPSVQSPEDDYQNKELEAAVHHAIQALPEKCRIVFSMNRFDHLTYAEIAEIQNISIKTVETQMGRALKYLRKRLATFLTVLP